jgi:hypothetical protein
MSSSSRVIKVSELVLWRRSKCLYMPIVDVSFCHKGTTIPSLCPKAINHGCVLSPQGDDNSIAIFESYQSWMCPSPTGGRRSRQYVLKLSIMDVSFPDRGMTIPSLFPKAIDCGCVLPPQGDDNPVTMS